MELIEGYQPNKEFPKDYELPLELKKSFFDKNDDFFAILYPILEKYIKNINNISDKDYMSNIIYGKLNNVLFILIKFNLMLIKKHPVISNDKKLYNYIKYYNDLIIIKMKETLFKKESIKIKSKISNDLAIKIYELGKEISVIESYNKVDLIKERLVKFLFYQFLLFDFVCDENYKIGYFTSFENNKKIYEENKNKILNEINELRNMNNLYDFIEFILKNYLNEQDNVLNAYIQKRKNEKIYIEPFTYFIIFEIWKHNKILKLNDEYFDELKLYFKCLDKVYYKNENLIELFEKQYYFIEKINNQIEYSCIDEFIIENLSAIKFEIENMEISDIKYNYYKNLKDLIEKEYSSFINDYFYKFSKSFDIDKKAILIGLNGSGVFLSHIYNLFNGLHNNVLFLNYNVNVDIAPVLKIDKLIDKKLFIIDSEFDKFGLNVFKNKYLEEFNKEINEFNYISFQKILKSKNLFAKKIKSIKNYTLIDFNNVFGNLNNKNDYNYLLYDSKLFFNISMKIHDKYMFNDKTINIKYNDIIGESIALMVGYLLKIRNKKISFNIDCQDCIELDINKTIIEIIEKNEN